MIVGGIIVSDEKPYCPAKLCPPLASPDEIGPMEERKIGGFAGVSTLAGRTPASLRQEQLTDATLPSSS